MQKTCAPSKVRQPPEIFCFTFGMRMARSARLLVNGAYYNLNYDLLKDLAPIAMIATNPQLIVSKMGVPAKDLKELMAWLKTNSDKFKFATGGVGGSSHIGGIYFLRAPLKIA